jgi:hypothetical protein
MPHFLIDLSILSLGILVYSGVVDFLNRRSSREKRKEVTTKMRDLVNVRFEDCWTTRDGMVYVDRDEVLKLLGSPKTQAVSDFLHLDFDALGYGESSVTPARYLVDARLEDWRTNYPDRLRVYSAFSLLARRRFPEALALFDDRTYEIWKYLVRHRDREVVDLASLRALPIKKIYMAPGDYVLVDATGDAIIGQIGNREFPTFEAFYRSFARLAHDPARVAGAVMVFSALSGIPIPKTYMRDEGYAANYLDIKMSQLQKRN